MATYYDATVHDVLDVGVLLCVPAPRTPESSSSRHVFRQARSPCFGDRVVAHTADGAIFGTVGCQYKPRRYGKPHQWRIRWDDSGVNLPIMNMLPCNRAGYGKTLSEMVKYHRAFANERALDTRSGR